MSILLARRMAMAIMGAASLAKPVGRPRFRSVIRVVAVSSGQQRGDRRTVRLAARPTGDHVPIGCDVRRRLGVVWWVLGGLILMPLLLGMSAFAPLLMPPMRPVAMGSLVGHLLYGLILGLVYVRVYSGSRVRAASGAYPAWRTDGYVPRAHRRTGHMTDLDRSRTGGVHPFVPLVFRRRPLSESIERARSFAEEMSLRRTTRHFSTEPVPRELIQCAIQTAGSAPSGAHQQPWTFVAVSESALKERIREAAEREEYENYHGRMPREWLDALAPLGTDEHKTHLTDAPWVVVLFRQIYGFQSDGGKRAHYYTQESCGIAAGLFIAAVHHMGLATLPHTPTPMGFLGEILERPPNERAMLVLPVGYPAADAKVPDIRRKALGEIAVWR